MGHFEICQLLLNTEAHAGVRDSKGLTPLHLAAWGGHMRVAQLLLTGTSATSRASVNVKVELPQTSIVALLTMELRL
jgi:ankyrin repeat protein